MTVHSESLLHYLRRLTAPAANEAGDAVLLERFASQDDPSAFTALLARHGPMVLGVCRRILRDSHEAEDAFQATFLVLARKAGSLRRPEALASWLYGTARHLASTARRAESRRYQREGRCSEFAAASSSGDLLDDLSARELLLALDEELARLPETYRLPLILCHLEGRTYEEAARLLGWSAGSVKGRLERGRKQLHARLSRRGLALGASALAIKSLTTATVSAALRQATMQRALTFAAGSAEGIAASILALAETGITSTAITKAKVGLLLLFVIGLAGGAGVLANPLRSDKKVEEKRAAAAAAPQRQTETPKSAPDKNAPTDLYGDPLPSGAIARLGTVRFRHGGFRVDAVVSADGRRLYSGGDHSLEWWDAQSGRRLRQILFPDPNYLVAGIDLSPDGKLLAVTFYLRNKMRFWDTASGAEVHPFGEDAPLTPRATFSPNGNLLAHLDIGNQRTVSIWDVRKGKKIRTIEGGEVRMHLVRSIAFSPNGNLQAFPRNRGVRVWDLVANKELYHLDPGAKTSMGCVAFSADGKLLAAAANPYEQGPDHAIHLWDMATGKEVGALKGHEDGINALAMSPKGNLLVSLSFDKTIRFWDLAKRQEIGRSPAPARQFVALSFSADGSVLASAELRGVLRLWDAHKHEEIATPGTGGNAVQWVRFAPDGQTLISAVTEQIGIWDPLTGQSRRIFDNKYLSGFYPVLSPDGKNLATTSSERTQTPALLWDIASGKLLRRFGESSQPLVSYLAFSPDGRRVAGGYYEQDTVRVWDAASGKELLQLKGQTQTRRLVFAPDGAALAVSNGWVNTDLTVRLLKLATGAEIWRKDTRPWFAFDLAFSPDGRTLAVVGALPGRANAIGELHLWESATGKEVKRFEGHRMPIHCVAFSTDGRMLATGSSDNTVRLWEVASGRERQSLQGHQNGIVSVSFSPDGRLLASASVDTTALVWDLTGRFRDGRFHERLLSAEELHRCWNDLALSDAARAYRSVAALSGSPKETITFLKDCLPPLTAADPKRVAPLLAALDSEQFAERDKAMSELETIGLAVEPALRKALNAKPSLEVRQRIETILEKLAAGPRLRFVRALEVLEQLATPEARQVLEVLSQGSAELWPAQEAKASLARLAARSRGR